MNNESFTPKSISAKEFQAELEVAVPGIAKKLPSEEKLENYMSYSVVPEHEERFGKYLQFLTLDVKDSQNRVIFILVNPNIDEMGGDIPSFINFNEPTAKTVLEIIAKDKLKKYTLVAALHPLHMDFSIRSYFETTSRGALEVARACETIIISSPLTSSTFLNSIWNSIARIYDLVSKSHKVHIKEGAHELIEQVGIAFEDMKL